MAEETSKATTPHVTPLALERQAASDRDRLEAAYGPTAVSAFSADEAAEKLRWLDSRDEIIRRLRDIELAQAERGLLASEADANFWHKRVVTVLGVANTAAAVALGTAFVQATDVTLMARLVAVPLPLFFLGICAAFVAICVSLMRAHILARRQARIIAELPLRQEQRSRLGQEYRPERIPSQSTTELSLLPDWWPLAEMMPIAVSALFFIGGLMEISGTIAGLAGVSR